MLQQAHPAVAAAADILLGQPTLNKTAVNQHGSTTQGTDSTQAETEQQGSDGAGAGAEGQGSELEIPWRQVAGLLHSQGVTDPQGLVSALHMVMLSSPMQIRAIILPNVKGKH